MAFKDLFIVKEATAGKYQSAGELLDPTVETIPLEVAAEREYDFTPLNQTEGVVSAEAIYGTAGVEPEFNRSIRNIEGFINSLPDSMDIGARKTALAGILAAAQFQVPDLVEDYTRRVNVLGNYLENDNAATNEKIHSCEQEIARMLQLIEERKVKITEEKQRSEQQRALIEEELNHLMSLKQFL